MNTPKPDMLSIKELLGKDKYIIPMYQRNYAWEESHLKQLVQDVWDCVDSERHYYIGTLVVHIRKDGMFETIDGQQRLTTLNIMMCALKNEIYNNSSLFDWFGSVNIEYEFRERSSKTLTALYLHDSTAELNDSSIEAMYDVVKRTIDSIVPEDSLDKFLDFFFNQVMITRVVLPEDTDLNHYFEIMNSRGEQLEKPEILKARIMRLSKRDKRKCWLIGLIWDACSDMDSHVQMNFSSDLRDAIFGKKWNECNWTDLNDLICRTQHIQISQTFDDYSILDVLKKTQNQSGKKTENENEDRFSSVVNFANFLLQVLRVIKKQDIPLDDKRLIDIFTEERITEDFADIFISEMLRLRFLFDRFIIKRDFYEDRENGKLSVKYLKHEKDTEYSYNLTIDDSTSKRIMMVESMFHASLPSQNYKHWLCATLNYLYDNRDGKGLVEYLEKLGKAYMLGRFLTEDITADSFYYDLIFNKGGRYTGNIPSKLSLPTFTKHIDFFIFNYIDYCLWKEGRCPDFEFTSRSSIEHFYPQHPMDNFPTMDEEHLHNIGNLCLISASKNSKLSNYQPLSKTEHYKNSKKIDSVKQKIMMDVVNKNKNKEQPWWTEEVEEQAQYIQEVLLRSFNS
ncbi:GmrSD restriction endonuclease domain-containing protein [Odoribacter lunatus]|uniref:GmrSD restriction endonuclease domain-containing protein n=1 Tax=Odoribacter lunatus TaxID=2941335 RepID=UPI00203AED37|nr:DUF262 domain-containing protein [Odoribacter lunatus]